MKKFKEAEYVKEHGIIHVYTGGKDYAFRIFACLIAQGGDSPAYICTFDSVEEQLAFIDEVRQESLVPVEYVPQPTDMFLTLSTCTGPAPCCGGNAATEYVTYYNYYVIVYVTYKLQVNI